MPDNESLALVDVTVELTDDSSEVVTGVADIRRDPNGVLVLLGIEAGPLPLADLADGFWKSWRRTGRTELRLGLGKLADHG